MIKIKNKTDKTVFVQHCLLDAIINFILTTIVLFLLYYMLVCAHVYSPQTDMELKTVIQHNSFFLTYWPLISVFTGIIFAFSYYTQNCVELTIDNKGLTITKTSNRKNQFYQNTFDYKNINDILILNIRQEYHIIVEHFNHKAETIFRFISFDEANKVLEQIKESINTYKKINID